METELLDGLYWEHWYNEGNDWKSVSCPGSREPNPNAGPCPVRESEQMVMYSNLLLGVPIIRQMRVTNSSCTIPINHLSKVVNVCYGGYSKGFEDKNSFGRGQSHYASYGAWRYHSSKELQGIETMGIHWGLFGSIYSGAGFVQSLSLQRNISAAILKELREGFWITRETRYVAVDFTLYNPNVNLFCVVRLNFEFLPTGGIVTEGNFNTVNLLRYIKHDYMILGCQLVFAAFCLYYLLEEMAKMKKKKMGYFMSFWNCLGILLVLLSGSTLFFGLYQYVMVGTLLKGLLAEPDGYANFSTLAVLSKNFQNVAAFTTMAASIKILKFTSFNKTMLQLAGTMTRSFPDLAIFSVLFHIMFISFAQWAQLIFGHKIEGYSSLLMSSYTQLRMILGDFDFNALLDAHWVLGPGYFFTFILLVFFILMNMFLAIINDAYSQVKTEVESRDDNFQMADFFVRGCNNVREVIGQERDKVADIKTIVKLVSADGAGIASYGEIRENLRKFNFSVMEIEIFCSQFDVNCDSIFTLNEINRINNAAGESSVPESPPPEEKTKEVKLKSLPLGGFNKAMFDERQERLESIENTMVMVTETITNILKKLNIDLTNEQPIEETYPRDSSYPTVD